jgi:hypothetical protein
MGGGDQGCLGRDVSEFREIRPLEELWTQNAN